jgi:hypothetical protein
MKCGILRINQDMEGKKEVEEKLYREFEELNPIYEAYREASVPVAFRSKEVMDLEISFVNRVG